MTERKKAMDQKERLKKLSQLADELQVAGNARPYDPDNYNRIVHELNALWRCHVSKPKSSRIRQIIDFPDKWWFALSDFLKKILKKAVSP